MAIDKEKKLKKEKRDNRKWILTITILAFVISFLLSLVSELVIPNTFIAINIFLVLLFIFIGIIFDIIGVAITTADESVFHSMATKRIGGATSAIKLIKNKGKVSSFCNDVIGDICGVISGSCGLTIALKFADIFSINSILVVVVMTSLISSLTIGGKAIGKGIALKNSNDILKEISRFIGLFSKK